MSGEVAAVVLLGVAFGLIGGLLVSRFGVKKGYGQLPFFVFGFIATFVLSFLPLIVFIIAAAFLVGAMSKLPPKSPMIGRAKRR